MTHLQQHHFGEPSRAGYHNTKWAGVMRGVGLFPSDTGAPDGRSVGQQMTHYIEKGGAFERACDTFVEDSFTALYVELWREVERQTRTRKAASKTRYSCPSCGLNAWAKPEVSLVCGACEAPMEADG